MTYHKPKAILAMANRLLNTRPDASSAAALREAASMLRDLASGDARLAQPATAAEREAFEKWVSEQSWFKATLGLMRTHDAYTDPCINSRWQGWQARVQPAQAVDVGTDFGAMNDALCAFAMRWEIDGDYLRCLKCKRPQITNYASHDFPHAHGCKAAGKVEARPWETFARLLLPLTRALTSEKAGLVGGWLSVEERRPERNKPAIYWHKSEFGGFAAIADEWRDEHHLQYATHWMPYVAPASPAPDKEGL